MGSASPPAARTFEKRPASKAEGARPPKPRGASGKRPAVRAEKIEAVAWTPMGQRRRLAALKRTLEASIRWAVFEANDEALWARARASISEVLIAEWQRGVLKGTTAEQAFFVRCDATTMNELDRTRGRLVVLTGLAFVKPAEFSVLRIEQATVT
ncbi:MAG: hypothetical protein FJY37_13735 [Betaproteobacteria bacterium]|nr:hypothetical protein [Betaproteobacteria bacterium]